MSKDPSVAPGTLDNDIGRVIEQINKSIDAKQIELGLDLAKATAKKDIIGIEKVQRGFDALRQANEYYSDGAKMFLNNNVKTFLRKVKEKEIKKIVKNNYNKPKKMTKELSEMFGLKHVPKINNNNN